MAWKLIKNYSVNWRPEENKGYVVVYYETYGFGIWVDSVQELSFMVDLLRNEKPVYFDPDKKQLNTSLEEVGEGENRI